MMARFLGMLMLLAACGEGAAQPAASFSARCEDLRVKADALKPTEAITVIQVQGAITAIKEGEGFVYITMCDKPSVRVMCITYKSNDRQPGSRAVIAGHYYRQDKNHILLDPCLLLAEE